MQHAMHGPRKGYQGKRERPMANAKLLESIDEAVEWLKRCPNSMLVDSEIEIRSEFEAADLPNNERSHATPSFARSTARNAQE
jgi:hypothetical protein